MWHNELSQEDKNLQLQIQEKGKLPQHIGIIMDGNGRWAEGQGLSRYEGHRQGIESVRDIVKACSQLGIEYLTLYSFSIENWNRPAEEVNGLMQLLELYLRKEVAELHENKVRIKTIGKTSALPTGVQELLFNAIELTKKNKGLTLTLALSYSSRWDIVRALQMIALDVRSGKLSPEDITEELFASYLQTRDLPDVDLLIRTSGELRLSNFMLWEMAYGEIFITDKLWPDFRREDLYEALKDYAKRERRFGKTSKQIKSEILNFSKFWNK
ncbi:MAG TPA: isoprenyl transferase [Bacteroidota bacterium]|nr:isoprenyl transferase [Candidatus Kapabacteria bacterium]HRS02122.1 isoprenyl transferase [Bacteroidota bacterium]